MEDSYNKKNILEYILNEDSKKNENSLIYKTENFADIPEDAPLNNLTFNKLVSLSEKYITLSKICDENLNIKKLRYALLRHAYNYNRTNINILEELNKVLDKNNKEENAEKEENIELSEEWIDILKVNNAIITRNYLLEIFKLIELLLKYNSRDIEKIYEITNCILETVSLQKISNNFNLEISISNSKPYFFSLYFAWLKILIKRMKKLKDDNLEKKDFYFDNFINAQISVDNKIKIISNEIKKILNIKEDAQITFEDLKIRINERNNKEIIDTFKATKKIIKTNDVIKRLDELERELNKNIKCQESLDYFCCNKFFQIYLDNLSKFLKKIPKTLEYLNGLDYSYININNIKILTNFVFFLSHFDFTNKKGSDFIKYYEMSFDEFKLDKSEEYLKIINNNLIDVKEQKEIKNINIYNLNYYKLDEIKKHRYLYEKYIKFNLVPEKNLFTKYNDIYLEFFKKLFLDDNSCVKKLFIKTFPVLVDNYFINEDFLNYIFNEKIHVFNFKADEFVGLTDNTNLNIYIKDDYDTEEKDELELEICVFATFIIILIHELAHFIRIYIFKHLGLKEYEESFYYEENEEPEIGRFIEKKLFGRVAEKLKISEALYILNIDNYLKKTNVQFLNDFVSLKEIKQIKIIEKSAQDFLKSVDINFNDKTTINEKCELIIKSSHKNLYIGVNNDKGQCKREMDKVYSEMNELYKLFYEK